MEKKIVNKYLYLLMCLFLQACGGKLFRREESFDYEVNPRSHLIFRSSSPSFFLLSEEGEF